VEAVDAELPTQLVALAPLALRVAERIAELADNERRPRKRSRIFGLMLVMRS
jgi:hypothetical protein